MAGGPGGAFDTPTLGQSLSYASLTQVVVESVNATINRTLTSPAPLDYQIDISVSTRSSERNWVTILRDGNYVTTFSNTYTSTAEDVAGMVGDLRFQSWMMAAGGSDRGIYLNDVNLLTRFASITDGTVQLAQSFTTPAGGYGVGGVDLMLKRIGTIGDITVEIQTDSGNAPSGTAVAGTSVTVPAANVPTALSWVTANFSGAPTLASTTRYWIVVRSASSYGAGNYLMWRSKINNPYSVGNMMYKTGAAAWAAQSTVDNLFRVKKGTGGVFGVDVDSRYKARWQ